MLTRPTGRKFSSCRARAIVSRYRLRSHGYGGLIARRSARHRPGLRLRMFRLYRLRPAPGAGLMALRIEAVIDSPSMGRPSRNLTLAVPGPQTAIVDHVRL